MLEFVMAVSVDLVNMLKRHEGFKSNPYICTAGRQTIGFGRNLDDKGITKQEAEVLLQNDISSAATEAHQWIGDVTWRKLSEARQCVVISLVFNIGLTRAMGFRKFRSALIAGDYQSAGHELLDSRWSVQVGSRATELYNLMING